MVDPGADRAPADLPHEHAWEVVAPAGERPGLLFGDWRCDLCGMVWSL